MGLSYETQLGKSGEHLVCADLILQGYNAFLADEGQSYDVLVDNRYTVIKIQVKSTNKFKVVNKVYNQPVYLFNLLTNRERSTIREIDTDYYAFVALDTRKIAYFPIKHLVTNNGLIKRQMIFKSRGYKYKVFTYPNGKEIPQTRKYLEDYSKFTIQ